MDVMFTHCAGLDVHKKTVMACRVTHDPTGEHADGIMELKEFGAMTVDLLALSDWLAAVEITHVAIESTGEYWKPLSLNLYQFVGGQSGQNTRQIHPS